MWRTHKNRADNGLGPTWSGTGYHESMMQDFNMVIPNASISSDMLWDGAIMDTHFDNPFLRWHKSFEDYPSFLNDMDDYAMIETDDFERLKKFKPLKKDVVGVTPILPRQDNDEVFEFYDIQGESVFSNPPNPNHITVDHGLDEDHIWAFQSTLYNQKKVKNAWMEPASKAYAYSYAPFWGEKLTQPHFYKAEKMPKFYRHWSHRLGLEVLKINQALAIGGMPTDAQRIQMKNEISAYITACYDAEKAEKFKDVYVTDHEPVDPKYVTGGEAEDQDYFEYQQALDEYNSDTKSVFKFAGKKQAYSKGSLMQKIMDPLAGAHTDKDGALHYHVEDKELRFLNNEEVLRAQYEKFNSAAEVWDVDEQDEDAFRLAMLQELEEGKSGFKIDDFAAILDKELAVFQKDEKYDYVKDLKDAYRISLSQTTEQRIFSTLPDHVFWDIKKPQQAGYLLKKNRYNPFRGKEFENFF